MDRVSAAKPIFKHMMGYDGLVFADHQATLSYNNKCLTPLRPFFNHYCDVHIPIVQPVKSHHEATDGLR